MKELNFPLFKTKSPSGSPEFDLTDPKQRQVYFRFKAGPEIEKIKKYLENNTFVAILLGKKNAGKGTYSKLFAEAVGSKNIAHLSAGDIVRKLDKEVASSKSRKKLEAFLEANYRGYLPIDEVIKAQLKRSTKTLLPTEFVLALLKREIGRLKRKALFIDGFPRNLDQISYSLFFRDLIDYRGDPDFFVLIDVPEKVIDERIKYRVVCPKCQTPRNLKLLATKKVGYDIKNNEFYLVCDSPTCRGARMVTKEGDELGVEVIKDRLEKDEKLIKRAFSLYGIPKVLLCNSVPVDKANKLVDDYEITPEYVYEWNKVSHRVKTTEKPWVVEDDQGVPSYSLLPPPVVVSLIKQLADLF
ncbi:MAG TPA: nucleoside monophosphate kinase [Nevskiaceae bacterium]|nr:nucleoside monophosphate kinase [Nevskiaceae bacterium]